MPFFFDHYPYTNFHNVNLDWVLQAVKAWGAMVEQNNQNFINLDETMQNFRTALEIDWTNYQNALNADWVDYKNTVNQEYANWALDIRTQWVAFWNEVRNYLQNLDVSQEISDKLDEMLANGDLNPIIEPKVASSVSQWLDENITPTTPIIDSTLTISGAGADSKIVGELIGDTSDILNYRALEGAVYVDGGCKGLVGENISITSVTTYAHCVLDCTVNKKFEITTRRSTSEQYNAYIIETDENDRITKIYEGVGERNYDEFTYNVECLSSSKKLYVTVCRAGGQSTATATIFYKTAVIGEILGTLNDNIDNNSDAIEDIDTRLTRIEENEDSLSELEKNILNSIRNTVTNYSKNARQKLINFIFMTDLHYNGYGNTVTYPKGSLRLFKLLSNEKYVDFCAFGGDMYSDYNLSHKDAMEAMLPVIKTFGEINTPLFITKGNHECNGKYIPLWTGGTPEWNNYNYWILSSDGRGYTRVTENEYTPDMTLHYSVGSSSGYDSNSKFSRTDAILDNENDILFNTRVKDIVKSDDNFQCYYYKDFKCGNNKTIRIVVLNAFNSQDATGNGLEQQVLSTKQLSWITNDVLNISDKQNYYLLFIAHFQFSTNNGSVFYSLVDEYIQSGGNVIGFLHGHQHEDTYYTKLASQSEPMMNIIGVNRAYSEIESEVGTINEYCIDVITIDTVNDKVYETRIGRGSNRTFDFIPTQSINIPT